jgi:uncharacterized cupredoxin-like copper-binding protein
VSITHAGRHPRFRWAALAVVAAVALVGAACGGDDDEDASDEPAEETTQAAEQADGDVAAFCQARIGLEQAFSSEEPDVDAVEALLADLEASAPTEIAGNVTGLSGALDQAAQTGSDPTGDPAFADNIGPIDQFTLSECGYETVDVTAVEYAFEGVPETVPAGTTGFTLTNDGDEAHEMVIFRITDGVTGPIEDLFAASEEEIEQNVTFAGAALADPGQSGTSFVELEPGRYGAICFVPTGGEDGPPHFTQGMTAEFEVT